MSRFRRIGSLVRSGERQAGSCNRGAISIHSGGSGSTRVSFYALSACVTFRTRRSGISFDSLSASWARGPLLALRAAYSLDSLHAHGASVSFGTLRSGISCRPHFTARPLCAGRPGLTRIALGATWPYLSLRTGDALNALSTLRPCVTCGAGTTWNTLRTLGTSGSGISFSTDRADVSGLTLIARNALDALNTLRALITLWSARSGIACSADLTVRTRVAFVPFGTHRSGLTLRACRSNGALRPYRPGLSRSATSTGRTRHTGLAAGLSAKGA